jgi:hypothetical protein
VFPVMYELGLGISEDEILHSHRRENLKYYTILTVWTLCNMFPVTYKEDGILQDFNSSTKFLENCRNHFSSSVQFRPFFSVF